MTDRVPPVKRVKSAVPPVKRVKSAVPPKSIEWVGGLDGCVKIIDQTRLPTELVMLEINEPGAMWKAIQRLSIRGAPAIGIAAAMGAVLGIRDFVGRDRSGFHQALKKVCDELASARPTAVNLFWALTRMQRFAQETKWESAQVMKLGLLEEARRIRDEDAAMCRAIGEHGESLIQSGAGVLTHCNAGALATAELGTALAPMYVAHERGRSFRVFADETRPLLQGARLTAWELSQAGIDVTLLCDSMAGALMQQGEVDLVITGADRIAANGDVANKIGTYGLAVLAKAHDIPFYVAAPSSTFDLDTPTGSVIPIEQRDPGEIRSGFGIQTAPSNIPCHTSAFDITPAALISAIITEKGLIRPVTNESIVQRL